MFVSKAIKFSMTFICHHANPFPDLRLFYSGRNGCVSSTTLKDTMRHLLIGAFLLAATAAFAQTPSAMQVADEHNWGTVRMPADKHLTAEIVITNSASSGMLKILEVKPGCGCTRTESYQTDLQPGEKSTVKISLNVSPSQVGPITKTLMVTTLHGTDTAKKTVWLKANIERAMNVSPTMYVAFNDLVVGKESVTTLTFENPTDNTIQLSSVVVVPEMLLSNINSVQELAPHSKREVTIRCSPAKAGQINGSVQFVVNGNGDPEEFLIPVYGTASEPLQVGNAK